MLNPKQFASCVKTLGGYVADDVWNHVAGKVIGGAKTNQELTGFSHFTDADLAAAQAFRSKRDKAS